VPVGCLYQTKLRFLARGGGEYAKVFDGENGVTGVGCLLVCMKGLFRQP